VLISAAERKDQEGARVRDEQMGLMKAIAEVLKFMRKQAYALTENKSVDFVVLLAVIFSVVLVQIDTNEAPLFEPIACWASSVWRQA
jgi:NADH:ubiquinone oxidoreductase subunit H